MATTVNEAFVEFLRDQINLDPEATQTARASRDWLIGQIEALPAKDATVPELYTEKHFHYGSFARGTKIRELDDIDVIIALQARGTVYETIGSTIRLHVPDGIRLRQFCHDGSAILNSRRVINAIASGLSGVPQYQKAEIGRRGVAAVLKLKSYTWAFDIVPSFFTTPEYDGRTFYIIPDGEGEWMKSDPRLDSEHTTAIDRAHNGYALNGIRAMKYWNRRQTMSTVPSYLFECLLLQYFAQSGAATATRYVDLEIMSLLEYLQTAIYSAVPDPKGIEGDLNTLTWEDRKSVAARANFDTERARNARASELAGDQKGSIRQWADIFGPDFPRFGSQ